MKKYITLLTVIFIVGLTFFIFKSGGGPASEKPNNKGVVVAATIFPIFDIAREVVGGDAEVVLIVPPGASPHSYDLNVQTLKKLEKASVVFSVGHGLDDWISSNISETAIVTVDDSVNLLSTEDAHDGGEPHYWLSPLNAQKIARNIAKQMAFIDSNNTSTYEARANAYSQKLDKEIARWQKQLENLKTRKLVTFHNSFEYFAHDFDLEIVETFEPSPGKTPGVKDLIDLQKVIEEHGIDTLFIEPQLSKDVVGQFSEDLGLRVFELDPIGGVSGREGYIELIDYNVEAIRFTLQ